MCRHGSDGTLHRGKRKKGHLHGSSRARAVGKRHMEESLGCASLDAKEFAQTFSHFNCSHLHMPADLWNSHYYVLAWSGQRSFIVFV